MQSDSNVTAADHLRAATAALHEADDRLSAAWLAASDDRPPELDFARKLVSEAIGNVGTLRRAAVRRDPVEAADAQS